ncbi:IS4 family transposase [Alkalibacterium sp. s-m-22]
MEEGMVHPEQFEISNASEHDHDYLDVFVNQPLATYVFDRGYIDFESFDQMKWEGYFFVSRIKKNTVIHVVENLDIPKDKDSDVLSDQYVLLGGRGYLTSLLRLVTIRRKGRSDLRIITNDVFKTAEEIGNLYHSRWQIELFFKHMKQHMTIKTYYSKSEVGVENQLIMAMIVYLLTLLIKLELNLKPTIFQILRHLRSVKYESYAYFKALFEPG